MTDSYFFTTVLVSVVASIFTTIYLHSKTEKPGDTCGLTNDQILASVSDAVKRAAPAHPALGVVDRVLNLANIAVNAAEKDYKTSTIKKEDRASNAASFIRAALQSENVAITPELERVISGAITDAVTRLPKTHDESGKLTDT